MAAHLKVLGAPAPHTSRSPWVDERLYPFFTAWWPEVAAASRV